MRFDHPDEPSSLALVELATIGPLGRRFNLLPGWSSKPSASKIESSGRGSLPYTTDRLIVDCTYATAAGRSARLNVGAAVSDLSLRRLIDILNDIADRCAAIHPPDSSALDDAALKTQVDNWFLTNDLTASFAEAAMLCEQNNVSRGAAVQLRQQSADLVQKWTDIIFHDKARDWTDEEIGFYREEFGPFPLPSDDEDGDELRQLDRRRVLMASVIGVEEFARSLLRSVGAEQSCSPARQSTNEDRDAWMYEEKKAGKTHTEIRRALERQHSDWDQLDSDQAVGRAIDRYCHRKRISLIRRKSK